MARIRTIKPELPQSESMGKVSRDARLLFILTWTLADDSGRLRGSSRMLASLLFPYDDDAPSLIDEWISELVAEDCIQVYCADGATYIQIAKWLIHQKIDKPSPSKIPQFVESSRILSNVRGGIKDQGPKDQGPKEGIKDQSSALPPAEYPNNFDATWKLYPTRPGASKKAAFAAWSARLKAGVDAYAMEVGAGRYAAYVAAMQTEPQYIKDPASFFGPKSHWESDWTVPQQRASPAGYESAKDKSRREASEQLTGRKQNEQRRDFIDIDQSSADLVG